MLFDGKPFLYRQNSDHTIDVICTSCLHTVCSVNTLSAAKEAEVRHLCLEFRPGVAAEVMEH